MSNLAVTNEELVALADGELPEAEAERVHARIVADPELAERFAILAETRMLLEAAPVGEQAVPDRLSAMIAASENRPEPRPPRFSVIEGAAPAAASGTSSRVARRWPRLALPMAACFLFLAGGLAGYLSAGGALRPDTGIAVAGMSRAGISAALSSAASGSEVAVQGGKLRVIASHKLEDGRICREYTLMRANGDASWDAVDCRADGWRTELLAARAAPTGSYAPASGDASIDAFLSERGAEALSSEDERKILAP